jgi:hypothetical protein
MKNMMDGEKERREVGGRAERGTTKTLVRLFGQRFSQVMD